MAQDLDFLQSGILLDKQAADIIEIVDDLNMYLGFCQNGNGAKDTSAAIWAICKVVQSASATPYSIQILWSNGQRQKNQIWDNRAVLTYTFKQF